MAKSYNVKFISPAHIAPLRALMKDLHLSEDYRHPRMGFRIVVGAGSGSGAFLASDGLAPLGAYTSLLHALKSILFVDLDVSIIAANADAASEYLINKRNQASCVSHIRQDDAKINGN